MFPIEKNNFRIFTYDWRDSKEIAPSTYEKELIDFTESNVSYITDAVKKLKDIYYTRDVYYQRDRIEKLLEDNYRVANEYCKNNPVFSFLLNLEMENRIQNKIDNSNYEINDLYEKSLAIFDNMLLLHAKITNFLSIYCSTEGDHRDKFFKTILSNFSVVNRAFVQVVGLTSLDDDLFTSLDFEYPMKRGYYFDNLSDFIWFMFFSFFDYDINLCQCEYCNNFYLPTTRRKTKYCDRVQMEDGKTCKQLGPIATRKLKRKDNSLIDEYDKAVNRNYKRLERSNEKQRKFEYKQKFEDLYDEEYDFRPDITSIEYYDWLDKVQQAKQDYIDDKISEEKFKTIIHELDRE